MPKDGVVNYYGEILSKEKADNYFNCLIAEIEWKNDEVLIFGKHIVTKRETAWYGDKKYLYTYSNKTKQALIWTKELLELKWIIENITQEKFNSCLLNLYPNGDEGMSWHSDDEKSLVKNSAIASISLGSERKFSFKHKDTKETISIILDHGSLLVMKDTTQNHWLHSLPKSRKIKEPRINLTFRSMVNQGIPKK